MNHYKTIKWYLEKYPEINIHDEDEYVFRVTCGNGYIETVKMLLAKKSDINIRALNDEAFKWCCKEQLIETPETIDQPSNRLETAKWLASICPEYVLEIVNDKIINFDVVKKIDENVVTKETMLKQNKIKLLNLQIEISNIELEMMNY
jgi:hypothetical protein